MTGGVSSVPRKREPGKYIRPETPNPCPAFLVNRKIRASYGRAAQRFAGRISRPSAAQSPAEGARQWRSLLLAPQHGNDAAQRLRCPHMRGCAAFWGWRGPAANQGIAIWRMPGPGVALRCAPRVPGTKKRCMSTPSSSSSRIFLSMPPA